MKNALFYQLALTLIPTIGPAQAKRLLENYDVQDIFSAKRSELEKIEGIGSFRANNIVGFSHFDQVEQELLFIERAGIRALFITDADYPQRLLHCYDPPTLLFYRGKANLNTERIISIVGKRSPTNYGRQVTENLITKLAARNYLIVSGLALGTDAISHQSALTNHLPTVAILAHGLDSIYPLAHHYLARKMIEQGGLLTEFRSKTQPGNYLFLKRNRIIAGISDAVIVIESDLKGAGMETAELAVGYHREVFAVPGRLGEPTSEGCNYLIRTHQATIFSDAKQLLTEMNWA